MEELFNDTDESCKRYDPMTVGISDDDDVGVTVEHMTASWSMDNGRPTLTDVSFNVDKVKLYKNKINVFNVDKVKFVNCKNKLNLLYYRHTHCLLLLDQLEQEKY